MPPLERQSERKAKTWQVYVCDACGDIADAHGEPVGCVNVGCSAPAMRLTTVAEVQGGRMNPAPSNPAQRALDKQYTLQEILDYLTRIGYHEAARRMSADRQIINLARG